MCKHCGRVEDICRTTSFLISWRCGVWERWMVRSWTHCWAPVCISSLQSPSETTRSRNFITRVVLFVGKVSEGRDRVAVAHQHKIGHLVSYLEIQWPGHPPISPANTTLLITFSIFDFCRSLKSTAERRNKHTVGKDRTIYTVTEYWNHERVWPCCKRPRASC